MNEPSETEIRNQKEKINYLKPMQWTIAAAYGSLLLGLLIYGTEPSLYYMGWPILIIIGMALVCIFLLASMFRVQSIKGTAGDISFATILTRGWISVFVSFSLVCLLLAYQIPMKIGFLSAKTDLEKLIGENPEDFAGLPNNLHAGIYRFSGERTNLWIKRRQNGSNPEKAIFVLSHDHEAAFIYSPSGIDRLAYNSGAKGHLMGDWYWMKED